jgi:hypothetical protein
MRFDSLTLQRLTESRAPIELGHDRGELGFDDL